MRTTYVDKQGRTHATMLPAGAPPEDAHLGLALGPPPLGALGLPLEVEVRLHNELFARNILTAEDARRRPGDIVAACQAAYRVDAAKIAELYYNMVGTVEDAPPSERKVNGRKHNNV